MLNGKEKVYHDFNKFLFLSHVLWCMTICRGVHYLCYYSFPPSEVDTHGSPPCCLAVASRAGVLACCSAHEVCVLFTSSSNRPHAAGAIVRQWESQAKSEYGFHLCLSGAGGKMIWLQRSLNECLALSEWQLNLNY